MLPIVTESNNASTSNALPPKALVVSDKYRVFTKLLSPPVLVAISPEAGG